MSEPRANHLLNASSPICSSTPIIRWIGTPGAPKPGEGPPGRQAHLPVHRLLTCHWCHVMAHDASKTRHRRDPERALVSIKVDGKSAPTWTRLT